MELDNISHRQMIPRQSVTNFRSTSTDGKQNINGWARGECNRIKYTMIVSKRFRKSEPTKLRQWILKP
jgi:hypothetical protein